MKKTLLITALALWAGISDACTTFLLEKNGRYFFGRNYDWVTGNGFLLVNSRGVQKWSATDKSLAWTASYGSVTFNQYGKEFPTGGMNEKGLVVELMWLDGSEYPGKDKRHALGVLQWIQYQLDNAASITEVISSDQRLRISPEASTPLHYLVADASGKAATIEFLNGKMVVHQGNNLAYPVLANTDYASSVSKTKDAIRERATSGIRDNSLQRFATACTMLDQFKTTAGTDPLEYSFSILHKVAQGDFTKWSIVYDISSRKIHFTTSDQPLRRFIDLSALNFECRNAALFLPLNADGSGPVNKQLQNLSFEMNKKVLETSVLESQTHVRIPKEAVENAALIFNQFPCNSVKK